MGSLTHRHARSLSSLLYSLDWTTATLSIWTLIKQGSNNFRGLIMPHCELYSHSLNSAHLLHLFTNCTGSRLIREFTSRHCALYTESLLPCAPYSIQYIITVRPLCELRSKDLNLVSVPRVRRARAGGRSFLEKVPALSNTLPVTIRSIHNH